MTLIDKLEQRKQDFDSRFVSDFWILEGLDKAVNIVKHHKCIWKGIYIYHQESTCYALSCGNEYFDNYMGEDVDLFKYCPYCGGEIEFSEVEL